MTKKNERTINTNFNFTVTIRGLVFLLDKNRIILY